MTTWRLAGLAENLDLEFEGGDAIAVTHGEITVAVVPQRGDALVVAELSVEAPGVVLERLRSRAEAEERMGSDGSRSVERNGTAEVLRRALDDSGLGGQVHRSLPSGAELSLEQLDWLVGAGEVAQYATSLRHRLEYPGFRFVQLVRWIGGLSSASLPKAGQALFWSLDLKTWHEAPSEAEDTSVFGEFDFVLDGQWPTLLEKLVQNENLAEPLAWQIFHEAVELRYRSPRAAIVMALTAAEVGTKLLPSSLSPSASEGWLALEMPTPPMEKLIGGYLPLLTDKRVVTKGKQPRQEEAIPKGLRDRLVKASSRRNKLVHSNELSPADEEVNRTLADVYEYLYLLDWFSGQEWAMRRVSDDCREAYGLPGAE